MSYFSKTKTIGVTFSDKSVHLVVSDKRKGVEHINYCEKKIFPHSLFENEFALLESAIEWVTSEIKIISGYKAIPVYISIPDPVIYSHVFSFDELPKKSTDEFIEWKLSNLYHLNRSEYGFQNSLLYTNNNTKIVLSLAIPETLLAKLTLSFSKNHIPLMIINSQSCVNFNALKRSYLDECGVHMFVDQGCWSIIIWDENKNLHTIKSKWLAIDNDVTKTWKTLQANLERMIRVYIQSNPKVIINRVFITGSPAEDFIAWANTNQSIVFESINSLASVNLLDGCSLSESFAAIQ